MTEKADKFTFKTTHPTGRYRSFEHDYHAIKHDGMEVGSISDAALHKIRLMVMKEVTKEEPCPFKWITLKKESASVAEAKEWLNAHIKGLRDVYHLHHIPKD